MTPGAGPTTSVKRDQSTADIDVGRRQRTSRPRALPALAAIVAIVVCIAAGYWQQQRMHAKEARRDQLDAAARASPVSLARLGDDTDWAALRYLPVVATGEFVASQQILIDNKVRAGRAGYDVVTPLALADGRVVLVDRGWTAQGATRSNIPEAPPPAGVVSVRGRISLPPSGYFELRREPPAGVVWQNLDPARFAAATGLKVMPVVVEATAAPVPDDGLVRDRPPPDVGIETHRIYMVQWYAFAALAAILWSWFNRRQSVSRGDG